MAQKKTDALNLSLLILALTLEAECRVDRVSTGISWVAASL